MLHIASVFGEWLVNKESWNGLKFDDMIHMVNKDFGIDKLIHEVELSYALLEPMMKNMPKDTPPVFVNNDRQLDSFCDICRSMPVRLCISVKNLNKEHQDQGLNFREISVVSGEGDKKMNGNSSNNVGRQNSNDEIEVEFSNVHDGNVIQKGQWFKSKSDLSWKIRMLAIERKFRFLENFGNAGLSMKPDLILTILKKRYGIDSKYWKTWRSREDARNEVMGSLVSNYAQLPVYIEKNKKYHIR